MPSSVAPPPHAGPSSAAPSAVGAPGSPGSGHGRRAVVTGGAGFLGSHLCTRLLADGWDVVCLDNFLTGDAANVAHLLDDPAFHLRRCDLVDFVHVPGDVDLVLHFASPASPVDYAQLPIETLRVGSLASTVTATHQLLPPLVRNVAA